MLKPFIATRIDPKHSDEYMLVFPDSGNFADAHGTLLNFLDQR